MTEPARFEVIHYTYGSQSEKKGDSTDRLRGGEIVHLDAGPRGVEHVKTPVGRGFDRKLWARRVEVYISPTGRSVRVFVDGFEVAKGAGPPSTDHRYELVRDALIHLIDTADEMAIGDDSVTRAGHVRHAAENGRRALLGVPPL